MIYHKSNNLKDRSYVLLIQPSPVKNVPKLCKSITQSNPLIIIYMYVRFMHLLIKHGV